MYIKTIKKEDGIRKRLNFMADQRFAKIRHEIHVSYSNSFYLFYILEDYIVSFGFPI